MTFWDALPVFWIADADAIKTVNLSRVAFPKEVEGVSHFGPSMGDVNAEVGYCSTASQYEPLEVYGPSVNSTKGDEWKRHRSVANSAFNEVCTKLSNSLFKQLIPFTSLTMP